MGLFNRNKPDGVVVKSLPTHDASLTLTAVGKEKAEQMTLPSPYFEILSGLLEAGGTTTIADLADKIGWEATKVRGVANSLVKSSYIKKVKV